MLKSESVHGNSCVCGGVCGSVSKFSEHMQSGVYLCLSALCVCVSVCAWPWGGVSDSLRVADGWGGGLPYSSALYWGLSWGLLVPSPLERWRLESSNLSASEDRLPRPHLLLPC